MSDLTTKTLPALIGCPSPHRDAPSRPFDREWIHSLTGSLHPASQERLAQRANRLVKGAMDRAAAALLLLLLAPLLLALAVAIRLESSGPILFRQTREGWLGKPFTILKFRTMHTAEPSRQLEQTRRDDPRCTRIGSLLRRTSLDELPQLINVLRGDMSMVGPRPHAIGMRTEGLTCHQVVSGYARRHDVKPGMTGLAQVSGCRGATHQVEQLRRRVALDLDYVAHWSLALDAKIVVQTLRIVFEADGAF